MVTLTAPVAVPNITKFQVISFDLVNGYVIVRVYYGAGTTRSQDFSCTLSDAAAGSRGVAINGAPVGVADTITPAAGVGAANALTNAIAAYRGAASHAAGLKALELQGVTDGWVAAALGGT